MEVDETLTGGRPRAYATRNYRRKGVNPERLKLKGHVVGMVQRGGEVRAKVTLDRDLYTLLGVVSEHVLPSSILFTDELQAYKGVARGTYGYPRYGGHRRIRHSDRIYVSGDVHTQTIEGFFSLVKNGIRGTYHAVSKTHLQGYLNEYAWRYNRRGGPMFKPLLAAAAQPRC